MKSLFIVLLMPFTFSTASAKTTGNYFRNIEIQIIAELCTLKVQERTYNKYGQQTYQPTLLVTNASLCVHENLPTLLKPYTDNLLTEFFLLTSDRLSLANIGLGDLLYRRTQIRNVQFVKLPVLIEALKQPY